MIGAAKGATHCRLLRDGGHGGYTMGYILAGWAGFTWHMSKSNCNNHDNEWQLSLTQPFGSTATLPAAYAQRHAGSRSSGSGIFSSRSTTTTTTHRPTDCSICEKYGNGPCGPYFWEWWDCTELHRHEDNYTSFCKDLFAEFQACANQHLLEENPFAENNNNNSKMEGTASAWQNFLEQELANYPRLEFPKDDDDDNELQPRLTTRHGSKTSVGFCEISLLDTHKGKTLLAAVIVKRRSSNNDKSDNHVIAAASAAEMMERDGTRSISFLVPPQEYKGENSTIEIMAVYENDEDESVQVFQQIIHLLAEKEPDK